MHFVRLALTIAAGALLIAAADRPVQVAPQVRCLLRGSNQTICRIDEPIVVSPDMVPYPQVRFRPGDQVVVHAGGCVQTDGLGDTWKRYVDPRGDGSDSKYWGTIIIPGATRGAVRLSEVRGKTLTLGPVIPQPSILQLGYVDDDYSDNGYSSHDNGTGDQCKNEKNAFVELTIIHTPGTAASCAGSSGTGPLDLVWTNCDLNGFPMNPVWASQANADGTPTGNVAPGLTTQCSQAIALVPVPGSNPPITVPVILAPKACMSWPVTFDSGNLCGSHINYFAVTYHGLVDWWQKSDDRPSLEGWDDDYNYYMDPQMHEGEAGDDPKTRLEIEFDSDETIDHFSDGLPLWTKFRGLVDNDNNAAATMVHQKNAVVTSLIGFDCYHPSCGVEEHPAYAMAVDMDDSNLADDQWGVFARNWGNEGMCSDNDHNLLLNDLKVLIPWHPGMSTVSVVPDTTEFRPFSNSDSNFAVRSPRISVIQGQGVLLEFHLPDPSAQMGVAGEVHLQWTPSPLHRGGIVLGRVSPAGPSGSQMRRPAADNNGRVSFHPSDEEEKPESRVSALLSKLPAADFQALKARLPAMSRTAATPAKLAIGPVLTLASLPARPGTARLLVPQSVPNARLAQRNELLRSTLCQQYKNNVPGYPGACQPMLNRTILRRMENRP